MTTKQKIDAIIQKRYGGFESRHGKIMKRLFDAAKTAHDSLTLREKLLQLMGVKPKPREDWNDKFLELLLKLEKENPRPVYKNPLDQTA